MILQVTCRLLAKRNAWMRASVEGDVYSSRVKFTSNTRGALRNAGQDRLLVNVNSNNYQAYRKSIHEHLRLLDFRSLLVICASVLVLFPKL
ncbi:hypothetical protein PILCRDRAFT_488309 [Piloderma croceum F 1598]|uniref:Uncharacterized protein n=1 Tax=Piloderma croceum (strain F 1598) TaxID=765440 RepID=A0A0C3FPT5_PILCF|nr:hypothetical protein PILCRDRAFT_488309 [Piloderma croceum F 1598]